MRAFRTILMLSLSDMRANLQEMDCLFWMGLIVMIEGMILVLLLIFVIGIAVEEQFF